MPFDGTDSFPAVQYAFFSKEGGQWVFRGNNVASVHELLEELLTLADETDGPGLLSTIQNIKAAGLIKEATGAASGGNRQQSSSTGTGDFPGWVMAEAAKVAGHEVSASDIKTGIAKTGRNAGKPWYKYGDTWLNPPRG